MKRHQAASIQLLIILKRYKGDDELANLFTY